MKENIDVTNLNFSWGNNHVLKDLNLSLKENELVSIIGINGAGKSTLLKCLNRILKPDSGEISIFGKELSDVDLIELAQHISYVPQSIRSNFSMDVFDVVLLGRRPHIQWRIAGEDREKVSKTLRYLNLEEFAFRRFDQLSGGERQRVIIAKAVAQDPAVYLFDEPTSDLDLKNQIEIMKRIKELISVPESSKSALIAIHDINIAARFSDRILLLHEGRIIANGTPQEVLTTKNIAEVFNVTSEIVNMHPNYIRIIIKDEINKNKKTKKTVIL
tara:strand:+ start:4669 stop:5487 length:819 start_codon:yes stop_codon:yes gene_type:complete